jgi:putative acetyltransferase
VSLVIRAEVPADAEAVRAVHEAAFPTDAEARLVGLLHQNGRATVSLVAELEGRVVGHVLFSPVSVETSPSAVGLGLAPVAVLPEFQRRGVGSGLIREGLDVCRRMGVEYVVLVGHPDYYPRFGFRRAGQFGLGNEYGADEAFQVIELRPGGIPSGGLVRYGPEFAMFSES